MTTPLLTEEEAKELNQKLENDFQNFGTDFMKYQSVDLADLDFAVSDRCEEIFTALAAASSEIGPTTAMTGRNSRFKSESNNWQGTPYSTLDDVLTATKTKLGQFGLAIIMPPTGGSKTGGYFIQCMLVHSSGQYVKARYQLPVAANAESQVISSANTYGRRIMELGMLNMAPGHGEDDDANAASPRNQPSDNRQQPPSNNRNNGGSFYGDSGAPRQAPPEPPPKPELKGGYKGELPDSKAKILGMLKNCKSMSRLAELKAMINDMVRMQHLDDTSTPEVIGVVKSVEDSLTKDQSMKVNETGLPETQPATQE